MTYPDRLLNGLEIIHSNLPTHLLCDKLLYILEEFYHFERINLIIFEGNRYPFFLAYKNMDPKYISLYKDLFYKKDVFVPFKVKNLLKDRYVLTYSDVTDLSEFKKGEYYNDFIRPQQIEEMLMISIPLSSKQSFVIGIACSIKDTQNFDLIQELNLLARHLRIALNNSKQFEISQEISRLLDAFCHCTFTGIVLLNSQLEPIFFTRNASNYWKLLGGNINSNEGIPTIPLFIKTLCDQISHKLAGSGKETTSGKAIHTVLLENQALEFEVYSLPMSLLSPFGSYLILIKDTICIDENCHRFLRNNYKLTNREIEIISLIISGHTNKEIANQLFISLPTVKEHIRNIFDKMNIKNRTSLCQKINHFLRLHPLHLS